MSHITDDELESLILGPERGGKIDHPGFLRLSQHAVECAACFRKVTTAVKAENIERLSMFLALTLDTCLEPMPYAFKIGVLVAHVGIALAAIMDRAPPGSPPLEKRVELVARLILAAATRAREISRGDD